VATRRRVRPLKIAAVVAALVAIFVAVAVQLPSGTGAASITIRAVVALVIGVFLIVVVRRMLGALGEAPPPPPAQVDARPAHVVYACNVCGTRLRLEVAATGKAPKHCGEEMEPTLA
jgi:peptidoglycan/LPS O-acetylase OafA/YrhL